MASKKSARTNETSSAGSSSSKQETPAAPPSTDEAASQAAGLDAAHHAAAQRVVQGADILREVIFPAGMAASLGLDKTVMSGAYKVFLDRFVEEAACPNDPVARMLLEQLALAHFRIAQLHARAGEANSLEAVKLYNSAASRLLGEFRRLALAWREYRSGSKAQQQRLKVYQQAQ